MSLLRVAAVAWRLRPLRGDGDFYGHFHDLVSVAHEEGAQVVVFPESHSLELLNLAHDIEERDVPAFLIQFASEIEAWIDRISRSSGLTIIGGSHLRQTPGGIRQVCAVGNGEQGLVLVEKNRLTDYERTFWKLDPGRGLAALPDRRLGVALGRDAEFPESGRVLANRGVLVQAIPARAEDTRAFSRLRLAAHARANENQVFTVHASLLGDLGRAPVASTYGTTAILAPNDAPFPELGILGETQPGEEAVIVRNLDFDALAAAREATQGPNWEWEPLQLEDELT